MHGIKMTAEQLVAVRANAEEAARATHNPEADKFRRDRAAIRSAFLASRKREA